MKIKQLSETTAGAVASVAMPLGSTHKRTEEAANPAQQAAIAVNMKKAGKKPKNMKEGIQDTESFFYQFAELFSNPDEYSHPDPMQAVDLIAGQFNDPEQVAKAIINFAKANPDELQDSAVRLAVHQLIKAQRGVAEGTYKGPHGEMDIDRSKKGVTKVTRKHHDASYSTGVPSVGKDVPDYEFNLHPNKPHIGLSKLKKIKEGDTESQFVEINPNSFLDDDFYAFDPETKVLKGTWSHKSVGRRHHEYEAQQKGYEVVSGMKAKRLGLVRKQKQVDEGGFDIPEIPRAPTPKPPADKSVKEGMRGLDERIKAKIQNIAVEVSDIPGYWDWKRDRFTPYGVLALQEALKNNEEYIKYALSLTSDDYGYGLEEGKDDSLRKAITDFDYNKNNEQPVAPSPKHIEQIKKDVSDFNKEKEKEEKQKQGVKEDWQKVNKRDKTDGMSRKAVKAYRRENPGSKLKTAVTTKPSKLKKGSKSAKRRKSFCARMSGMKKAHASAKTKRNPDSPINKALRRWNCESVEDMRNLVLIAEQKIAMLKDEMQLDENLHKWFKEKWVRFGPDGKIRGDCARGDDSEGKPKCLPQSKAQNLGKKGRASAAARKRREDPNPERSGKAINVATKKKTNEEQLDELKCWPGYHRVKGTKAGAPGSCAKNESMAEGHEMCPECGGAMYSEEMINEKKDACYYKVKSRYKVWPSAYASGALVKCRKKGAKNWGTKSESIDTKSNILKGMAEAKLREEELLLAPGQGVRFKTELMPKRTDHEVEMARNQLRTSFENAKDIYHSIEGLSELQGLDGWVQAKITKASDYLEAVNQYLEGKKQMLEKELEVAEDQIDDRLTAQYNTPQMKAQNQAVDQAFASGDEAQFKTLGIMSPQQIEKDYQTMRAGEIAQDAALMRNPKLTPSARPVQRYNPKGVPIKEIENQEFDDRSPQDTYIQSKTSLTSRDGVDDISKRVASLSTDRHGNQRVRAIDTNRDLGDEVTINTMIPKGVKAKIVPQQGNANIEEAEKLSAREKFKRGLKRAGYDPDAGADRLLRLIARQAEERREFERKQKEQDEEFYKNRKLKEQDPQPVDNNQQEQPKSNKLFDVLKSIGDVALPVGRAIYGMQGRDIPADIKSDVKTMIRNKVTGEPNK